jgi:hypothetical protein
MLKSIMRARAAARFFPSCIFFLAVCLFLAAGAGLNAPPALTPAAWRQVSVTPGPAQRETLAAAAATPTPVPSPTPWEHATYTPTSLPADLPAAGINPLTGLPAQDPPLLIKDRDCQDSEWLKATDGAGLNQADLCSNTISSTR